MRVLTFDRLYAQCLNAAGEAYIELSEPVLAATFQEAAFGKAWSFLEGRDEWRTPPASLAPWPGPWQNSPAPFSQTEVERR